MEADRVTEERRGGLFGSVFKDGEERADDESSVFTAFKKSSLSRHESKSILVSSVSIKPSSLHSSSSVLMSSSSNFFKRFNTGRGTNESKQQLQLVTTSVFQASMYKASINGTHKHESKEY